MAATTPGPGWFYQVMGVEVGPVSGGKLRDLAQHGAITPDTPIRKGSDGAWVPAHRVQGLFGTSGAQPAPAARLAAKSSTLPPPLSAIAPRGSRPRVLVLAGVVGAGVVVVLLVTTLLLRHTGNAPAGDIPAMKPAEAIAEKAGARKSSGQDEPGRASKTTFAVGTPEYVVAQYVKAASWQERLQYVKQTEGIREKMPQWYGNKRLGFECDEIESRESTGAGVGSIVTVDAVTSGPNAFGTIVKGNQRYYLEKTPQGYVILWEPSVGWLPLAWSAYTASRPEQPMTFPLNCELSDSYSGTMEKKINRTHYSLRVTPPGESGSSTAFVVRESPAGRIIFDTLRTGESISVGDYEGLW